MRGFPSIPAEIALASEDIIFEVDTHGSGYRLGIGPSVQITATGNQAIFDVDEIMAKDRVEISSGILLCESDQPNSFCAEFAVLGFPEIGRSHSIRSASTGEIDAARPAGIIAAKNEQIASATAATLNASGSHEETP